MPSQSSTRTNQLPTIRTSKTVRNVRPGFEIAEIICNRLELILFPGQAKKRRPRIYVVRRQPGGNLMTALVKAERYFPTNTPKSVILGLLNYSIFMLRKFNCLGKKKKRFFNHPGRQLSRVFWESMYMQDRLKLVSKSHLELCYVVSSALMARTHVRIKGQNLNFYLETHATTYNIYFIRLRIQPRFLVHYTGVWMAL